MHGLHAYLNTLLLLHSALNAQCGEYAAKRGGWSRALISHGNYIVDHGKSRWSCVFEFLWEPCSKLPCVHTSNSFMLILLKLYTYVAGFAQA